MSAGPYKNETFINDTKDLLRNILPTICVYTIHNGKHYIYIYIYIPTVCLRIDLTISINFYFFEKSNSLKKRFASLEFYIAKSR